MAHARALELATKMIEEFEGIRTEAYRCPAGIPTICAGLTHYPDGTTVQMGDVCSEEVCAGHLEALLIAEFLPGCERIPGWEELGPNRQASMLDFAWNMGAHFYGADGFNTISSVLTRKAYGEMRDALALYVKGGGGVLPGLVRRRDAEADLWEKEDDGPLVIKCINDTYLKAAAIDSKYLSEGVGRIKVAAGMEYEAVSVDSEQGGNHALVEAGPPPGKWFVYWPHWEATTKKPEALGKFIDWGNHNHALGVHITTGDLLQFDARKQPIASSADEKQLIRLAREFDRLCESWGGRLCITGAYEPKQEQLGPEKRHFHNKGMALDITPIDESPDELLKWLRKRWSGGLGDYTARGYVQVDIRGGGGFSPRPIVSPAESWVSDPS